MSRDIESRNSTYRAVAFILKNNRPLIFTVSSTMRAKTLTLSLDCLTLLHQCHTMKWVDSCITVQIFLAIIFSLRP
jgi:hypothetical protein